MGLYKTNSGLEKGSRAVTGAKITTIGLDADDTLWHNERFFRSTQQVFADLLRDHAEPETLDARLLAAEKRNIGRYGFGIKGFVLSMIETAIEVTDDRVPATVIRQIIEAGQEMLAHPVDLLPHAREARPAHVVLARAGALVVAPLQGHLKNSHPLGLMA